LNKKVLALIVVVIVPCVSVAAFLVASSTAPTQQPTGALDFTVSGTSDCLRFLNSSVPAVYVPFTVAANENCQLTINCTKMSGGTQGYTDVYVYSGYWNGGANHTCTSAQLYPILNDIRATNQQIRLGTTFTATYGDTAQESYTIFFVLPPGGQQSTFHVTLQPLTVLPA
jgi:hypothetical protein